MVNDLYPSLANLDSIQRIPFNNQYDVTKPFAFYDLMNGWSSFGKWSLSFFSDAFGDKAIIAERVNEGVYQYKSFLLSEFIDYALNTSELNAYHGRTEIHLHTELKKEFEGESSFPCWYKKWHRENDEKQKVSLSDIFIGPKGSYSHLHKDIWGTSFWNALFEGRKLWLFFDHSEEGLLYDGHVNPFYPDFKRFPKFRMAQPKKYVQRPGELIYCPGNVYHAVMALEPSLALSENFIDLFNYKNVIAHFERTGSHRALSKMKRITYYNLNLGL